MLKKAFLFGILSLLVAANFSWAQNNPGQATSQTSDPVQATVQNIGNANPIHQSAKELLPEVVAEVNGESISRNELIQESLRIHGEEVLDRILNRSLVLAECKRQNITITRDEVEAEFDRIVKATPPGNLTREQFLEIVQKDNNLSFQDYVDEVVWPKLALQALVVNKIQVSDEEIERKYLSTYGPSVGMQMLVTDTKEKADALYSRVVADPDSFGELARNESLDVTTASNKGRMQPVFHYTMPDKELEDRFFAMNIGDITEVIGPYGPSNQFMIFKCENKYDPVLDESKVGEIKEYLRIQASSDKLKSAAAELYAQLRREAKVVNILADPKLRQQYPNVAATVNEQSIWLESVTEMCLKLYSYQDLESMISLKLIQQECKKVQLNITDQDIDTDIWLRAAETTMPLPDGQPNIQEYLEGEKLSYGMNEAAYRSTIVWPKVALQKLSAGLVKITDEDVQKSFDANFGESVQCLGIVLKDERQARKVWQEARTRPQAEGRTLEEVFGDLAAEYSLEPGSKQLRGRISPIIKNGGSPEIEEEAFSLKPGDLSSIIQVDRGTFVILYCLEILPAKDVTLDQVRDSIKNDLQRKKEVLAIGEYYTNVIKKATYVNHLTGESKVPETKTIPTSPAPAQAAPAQAPAQAAPAQAPIQAAPAQAPAQPSSAR